MEMSKIPRPRKNDGDVATEFMRAYWRERQRVCCERKKFREKYLKSIIQ